MSFRCIDCRSPPLVLRSATAAGWFPLTFPAPPPAGHHSGRTTGEKCPGPSVWLTRRAATRSTYSAALMNDLVTCAVCGESVEVDRTLVITQTREPIYGTAPGRGAVHAEGSVVHQCS